MLSIYRYVAAMIALAIALGSQTALFAQDETGGTPSEGAGASAEPGNTGPIQFAGTEDTSLFVGHYRLNPGDSLEISILSDTTQSYWPMIDEDGYVVLPVIGPVLVADLTASEARDAIQALVDQYYQRAWVTVRVTQLGKVKFYVYGDVPRPGFYTAPGATTVFDFLQTFGLTQSAAHRRIVHVRGNPYTAIPEHSDLLAPLGEPINELIEESLRKFKAGDTEDIDPRVTIIDPLVFTLHGEIEQRNFYLELGDVIYVPDPAVTVTLDGFRRSGMVEVLPGETWPDIMTISGAPDLTRNVYNMVIERRDDSGRLVQLYYNLDDLQMDQLKQIPVEDRDTLRALPSEVNVYVLGAVNRGGAFPYQATLTPYDYLTLAGGPTAEAHLRFAVILRPSRDPVAPLEDSTLIPCDLVEPLVGGEGPSGLAMEPGDILYVPEKGARATMETIFSALSVLVNTIRLFQ